MSWLLLMEGKKAIWTCTNYFDLQYNELNNLAEYGQPFSPYQVGFDHDLNPDFETITVRMTQLEIMTNGYGRKLKPTHFPIVNQFLAGSIKTDDGIFSFEDLRSKGLVEKGERFFGTHLYLGNVVDSGSINMFDAAYIHGSISFALMKGTRFKRQGSYYGVIAELGANDDNWNFESGNGKINRLNPIVEVLFGPTHNNLQANQTKNEKVGQIDLEYRGSGRFAMASAIAQAKKRANLYHSETPQKIGSGRSGSALRERAPRPNYSVGR